MFILHRKVHDFRLRALCASEIVGHSQNSVDLIINENFKKSDDPEHQCGKMRSEIFESGHFALNVT